MVEYSIEVAQKNKIVDHYPVGDRYHRFLLLSTANLEEEKEDYLLASADTKVEKNVKI